MKFKYLSIAVLLPGIACLTSCFKDEPLNAECDIEAAWVHTANPSETFFHSSDTLVNVPYTDSTVVFVVKGSADLKNMAPKFKITEGATITPANGSVHDFSDNKEVKYTVTSQDGAWHRTYTVTFNAVKTSMNDTVKYDFEDFALEPAKQKYYLWFNRDEQGNLQPDWASGNGGFKLSVSSAKPDEYPTVPYANGIEGYGVKLTTCDTGPFGVWANKRIAAGNLFLGSFDVENALADAMSATHFGLRFDKKPVKMTGYYQYTPGPKFQDKMGKPVADRIDEGSIYAVFYKNHDENNKPIVLYGDNVKTSKQIVAIADLGPVKRTQGWQQFEIEFNYAEDIDPELLKNQGYNLAVVFSSSSEGDLFMGAVGSELLVDKVRVICTKTE